MQLNFTTQRPKTIAGKKQRDHVIPHALVIAFCVATIKKKPLIDAPKHLAAAFDELETGGDFSPYYLERSQLKPYNKEIIGLLKTAAHGEHDESTIKTFIENYQIGIRQQRADQITEALSGIISTYNQLPDVTAERLETKIGEGSQVHTALVALEAMDAFLKNPQNTEDFYKEAIEPHGRFVDGMAKIFKLQSIDQLRKDLKTAEKNAKKSENSDFQLSAHFSKIFHEKATNPELIGKLISYFFDYPSRRGRGSEDLMKLTNRCVKMIFKTFPAFEKLDREKIKESFIKEVLVTQWQSASNMIKEELNKQLNFTPTSIPFKP